MNGSQIPDWLYFDVWTVLSTGELYPQIRAIALKWEPSERALLMRFYFDRQPTEFDIESANEIAAYVADEHARSDKTATIDVECRFSDLLFKDLDGLDGFAYLRREYAMHENPSQSPTYINIINTEP